MHAAQPDRGGRGTELLLAHCDALDVAEGTRPPALERLQDAVGHDLARMLVNALSARGCRPARAGA